MVARYPPPRRCAGITMVEVAVLVAMGGVLTALAVPTYLNFSKRALLEQAIDAASLCQEAVLRKVRSMPATEAAQANEFGCEVLHDPGPSKYLRHMTTSANGVITFVPANVGDPAVDGQPLRLQPLVVSQSPPPTPPPQPKPPSGRTRTAVAQVGEAKALGTAQWAGLEVARVHADQGRHIEAWQCGPVYDNPQLLRVLPSFCRHSLMPQTRHETAAAATQQAH